MARNLTYKQIQAAHEARMWIKEVIVPVIGTGVVLASIPEVRKTVTETYQRAKWNIQKKFRKRGS